MQKAVDFIKGSAKLCVTGAFPERFLNICAQNNIRFWALKRRDACTFELRMGLKDLARVRPYAARVNCSVTLMSKNGIPPFLSKFAGRWALIFGIAAVLSAVLFLNSYIWEIHVEGNSRTTEAEILDALRLEGVGIGAKGTTVSTREIKDDVILRLPDLCWMAVNVSGSRATVLVRETLEAPVEIDMRIPVDIVAARDGIITSVRGYNGTNIVTLGQAVRTGDILIAGQVKRGDEIRFVRALGEVTAVTERDLSACSVLNRLDMADSGEKKTLFSLCFGENRINLYRDYGIFAENYDTITHWQSMGLPGGGHLPLGVVKQQLSGFDTREITLDAQAEEDRLKDALLEQITEDIGSDGQVFTCDFETALSGSIITVTAHAVCMEVISLTRELEASQ